MGVYCTFCGKELKDTEIICPDGCWRKQMIKEDAEQISTKMIVINNLFSNKK